MSNCTVVRFVNANQLIHVLLVDYMIIDNGNALRCVEVWSLFESAGSVSQHLLPVFIVGHLQTFFPFFLLLVGD